MPIIPASSLFAAQSRNADANKASSPSVFRQGASDIRIARLGESSIGTLLAKSLEKGGDASENRLEALRTATREASTFRATRSSTSSPPSVEKTTDDAATFSIRDDIRAAARTTSQAKRNVDVGVSLVATADSALTELTRITKELKTLAEQAADTSTLASRREALDREAQALKSEYARIIDTTEFNGDKILKEGFEGVRIQVGGSAQAAINVSLSAGFDTGGYGFQAGSSLGDSLSSSGVTGDFNGDGFLDLAVAEYASNGIRLSYGDGTGQYSSSELLLTGDGPQAVQAADFNSDGFLDLVAVNTLSNTVSVMRADGNGGFEAPESFSTGGSPQDVAVGDLDGDGFLDIAVPNLGDSSDPIIMGSRSTTTILFGGSDGSFQRQASLWTDLAARFIRIYDSGEQGDIYLRTGTDDYGAFYSHGQSGGGQIDQFSAVQDESFSGTVSSLLVADVDGDGVEDILAGIASSGTIEARLSSNGVIFWGENIILGSTGSFLPTNLGSGDFDGDGDMDLVLTDGGTALQIWEGDGNGNFEMKQTYQTTGSPVAIADFNGDGILDISGTSKIALGVTTEGTSTLLNFSLTMISDASQAVTQFSQKLDQLAVQQGSIESFQSRLTSTSRSLEKQTEVLLRAQRRIEDVNVAEDTSRAIRLSIINDATNAIRAQGLLQPDIALRLLA